MSGRHGLLKQNDGTVVPRLSDIRILKHETLCFDYGMLQHLDASISGQKVWLSKHNNPVIKTYLISGKGR